MRTYKAEQEAGIDFRLNNDGSSSSFVTAQVKVGDIHKHFEGMSASEIVKATSTVQTVEELLGQEHPDLALVVAILVSTGWNLNDDVFTPAEVWKARFSPLHKPMNDGHNEEKILGHIVTSRVLDKSGNEIEVVEGASPPVEFDIEIAGVLYKAFDKLSARIEEIITKANSGEMFVSMECWFPDFGYGLVDPKGGKINLIERNEATAFLTKHLRIYGGSGRYQGYQVGRVLKDMIFCAQGFVENPGNPESVIKVAASKVAASKTFVTAELSELPEGGVQDVDEQEMKKLQEKLEEAQASLDSKTKEVAELQKVAGEVDAKDYDGQIAALTEKVAELTANMSEASEKAGAVETEKADLQKQLDEVTARAEKCEAELDDIRKTATAQDRLSKLQEVKKVEDEEATLAELREMTDETFEVVLKYAGETKSEDAEDKSQAAETNETETETEDAGETAKATLDNVEEIETADLNVSEDQAETDKKGWQSMASLLCDQTEEGGE